MEAFTLIDGIVAVLIILSAILAFSRGLVRELLAIAGWVGAAVLAFIFAPQAEPLVKEIPILSDFIADSCELSILAAFAGVFAIALVLVSIFTPLFAGAVQRSAIGGLDQALGFLFGVLRGVVLVAVALLVYDRVVLEDTVPMVDNSQSARIFGQLSERLVGTLDDQQFLAWITSQYEELVGNCGAPAETAPAADTPAETPPSGT